MYTEVISTDLNYTKDETKKLKKTCEEFEALFLSKVFSSMRESVQESGLVEKSMGEEVFTEMMDSEVAKQSSEGEGLGLSKMLFESMSKYLQSSDGNNFPTGKNSAADTQKFLDLQRNLNGTDVASKINSKL